MKLIVGLGNPGKKYELTRHNAGFMAVDALRKELKLPEWKPEKKFQAEISSDTESGVALMKPQTFMNLSGEAVAAFVKFYKLDASDVLVVYDDVDLLFGVLRYRTEGSSGGHNGIQNIIDILGTAHIARLKIGVGHETKTLPTEAFVLQPFSREELDALPNLIQEACGVIQAKFLP
jgi:PTH1 family peptidyl-tRNA hydrolase